MITVRALTTVVPLLACVTHVLGAAIIGQENLKDIEVDTAPQSPQPYVIRHYANANATAVGSQIYRFPVTGNSSGGAFSLLSTSAPGSSALGVLPHIHERHYENFFNLKGRYQLWGQHGGEQQSRVLTAGDYGAVPPGTNHTFQMIDPDTELVGAIVPGGFEALFFALGAPWSSLTHTPYVPVVADDSSSAAGPDASAISQLESLDVYAQLDFEPRNDTINGAAPSGSIWHNGYNAIANDTNTPYFVANGWGPKFISSNGSIPYHIVQPLVNPEASGNYSFTLSKISINKQLSNNTRATFTLAEPCAFEILEGMFEIDVEGYHSANLTTGDVAFVPRDTTFSYRSPAALTQVLYISSGSDGLDRQLIRTGNPYGFVTFPTS